MKLVQFELNHSTCKRIAVNPAHVAAVYENSSHSTDIHFSAYQSMSDGEGGMAWFEVLGPYEEVVAKLEGAPQ